MSGQGARGIICLSAQLHGSQRLRDVVVAAIVSDTLRHCLEPQPLDEVIIDIRPDSFKEFGGVPLAQVTAVIVGLD